MVSLAISDFTPISAWVLAHTLAIYKTIDKSTARNSIGARSFRLARSKWEHSMWAGSKNCFGFCYSWFVCNHLATTKRKECNPKTYRKVERKNRKRNPIKSTRSDLLAFEWWFGFWSFQIFLVVNYRLWIKSEIERFTIHPTDDFTRRTLKINLIH